MKIRLILFGILTGLIVFIVGMYSQTRAQGSTTCTVRDFEATIQQGPDKGWSVTGDLALTIAADGGRCQSGRVGPVVHLRREE